MNVSGKEAQVEILAAIEKMFPGESVVELRIPKAPGGTVVGYFRDRQKLAAAIESWSGTAPAVYYTLNTPDSALYDAAPDRAKTGVNATAADQIVSRNWLLIDCDPIRLGTNGLPLKDQKVSSTDAEKAAALDMGKAVLKYLGGIGYPAPMTADSGNGVHLLYKLDLPNTADVTEAVKNVLVHLAAKFDTNDVKIDTSVYDPSRITKSYGSIACKGIATEARPHRVSHLRNITGGKVPVTLAQLQAVSTVTPSTPTKGSGLIIKPKPLEGYAAAETEADKLEEFFDFYNLDYKERKKEKSGYSWQLIPCPFDETHNVGEVGVSVDDDGRKGFKCFHESCKDRHWHEFVDYLQTKTNKRFFFTTNIKEAVPAFAETTNQLNTSRASNIAPEVIEWLWPNRIPFGKLTLFVGHPDVGKGFATIYVAAHASRGSDWADCGNTNESMEVVVISSEDAAKDTIVPRLMAAGANLEKIHIVHSTKTKDGEKEFSLDTDLPALRVMLEQNPKIKLVTIDPVMNHLGKIKGNSEQELRSALTPLGKLAEKFGCAMVIVTHYNKNITSDAIQRVGGAMGMVGAVRVAWSFSQDKDSGVRSMLRMKGNIIKDQGGLEYEIVGTDITIDGKLADYGRTVFGKKSDAFIETAINNQKKIGKVEAAMGWLSVYLADGKPHPAGEVYSAGAVAGQYEDHNLKRAYKKLGGKSVWDGGQGTPHLWQLPAGNSEVSHG